MMYSYMYQLWLYPETNLYQNKFVHWKYVSDSVDFEKKINSKWASQYQAVDKLSVFQDFQYFDYQAFQYFDWRFQCYAI